MMEFLMGVAVGAAGCWAAMKYHSEIWTWVKAKVFRQ